MCHSMSQSSCLDTARHQQALPARLGSVSVAEVERPLSALLDWVGNREAWLQTVAESLGSELVFYTSSHTVQNEYITRLCKDVEERQLTNDDGSVMQVRAEVAIWLWWIKVGLGGGWGKGI